MKAALPVKQDIFELVLDFYRSPSDYPELLDSLKPLPEGITDLLELTAGEVEARLKILSRAAASEAPSELIDAASYFSEQVLFAPGGDHYRILGLNHDVSLDDIREHYELIVRLFYQDKEDNSIQSNEADFSRLNRAYSILRDDEKRAEYDRTLEKQGRLKRSVRPKEDANEVESIQQATKPENKPEKPEKPDNKPEKPSAAKVRSIDSYIPAPEKTNFSESAFVENEKPVKPTHVSSAIINSRLPKILIVDDSATVRAGLSLTLNKGFECITAKDGEKAWKKLQQMDDILLVLTDLDMPTLNGYDLIKRIRSNADERINTLPVIVVTGTEDIDAKQNAISAGADDFLAKSTDYIEVLTRVKVHYRLVKTKQQLDESQNKPTQQGDLNSRLGSQFDTQLHTGSNGRAYPHMTDEVPILSEHKTDYKNIVTITAFAVVAIVLVSLLYLTQIKPDGETIAVINNDETGDSETINDTDTVLPEKSTKISRDQELTPLPAISSSKTNVEAVTAVQKTAQKKEESISIQKFITKPLVIPDEIKRPDTPLTEIVPIEKNVVSENRAQSNVTASEQDNRTPDTFTRTPDTFTRTPDTFTRTPDTFKRTPDTFKRTPDTKTQNPAIILESDESIAPVLQANTGLVTKKQVPTWPNNQTTSPVTGTPSVNILPDRLPDPTDAPSVNKIITEKSDITTPATSPGNNTLAFIEPPASLTEKPKISQRELALLIFRFIRSYEDGNLFQFMSLFSENAKTEDRTDLKSIEDDYKDLFRKSAARRFILGDLDWKHNNNAAEGSGFFEVKIWPKGGDKFKTFTGEVTIEVLKTENRGLVITGLFHKF